MNAEKSMAPRNWNARQCDRQLFLMAFEYDLHARTSWKVIVSGWTRPYGKRRSRGYREFARRFSF